MPYAAVVVLEHIGSDLKIISKNLIGNTTTVTVQEFKNVRRFKRNYGDGVIIVKLHDGTIIEANIT